MAVGSNFMDTPETFTQMSEPNQMSNDRIPPNPYPVKPPPNMPAPRKESLEAENARLKAEVEQLGAFKTHTIIPNELLQAEVERLQNNCDYLDQKLDEELDKSAMLCGQVERLTKAGDLLAVHYTALSKCVTPNNAKSGSINNWTSVIDWNAAKEGKQP